MKKIELTQGKYALVDNVDFERVSEFKWHFNNGYAVRQEMGKKIYMHRLIMGFPELYVDHINKDSLDNRQKNLRVCTNQQNQANSRAQVNNTSGYKGVYSTWGGRWRARLYIKGDSKRSSVNGGTFDTPKEAAKAYNKIAKKYFGEFAQLNRV